MGCTGGNGWSNRRRSKQRHSCKYKRNTDKQQQFSSDGNIYGNTGLWHLYRYRFYGNGNNQSETGSKCSDINNMQRRYLYTDTNRCRRRSCTRRYDLYMACTNCNRKYNRRCSKQRKPGKHKRNSYQFYKFGTDCNLYGYADLIGSAWQLCRCPLYSDCYSQSCAYRNTYDSYNLQHGNL